MPMKVYGKGKEIWWQAVGPLLGSRCSLSQLFGTASGSSAYNPVAIGSAQQFFLSKSVYFVKKKLTTL
jgi:hypothetical protein